VVLLTNYTQTTHKLHTNYAQTHTSTPFFHTHALSRSLLALSLFYLSLSLSLSASLSLSHTHTHAPPRETALPPPPLLSEDVRLGGDGRRSEEDASWTRQQRLMAQPVMAEPLIAQPLMALLATVTATVARLE
jgi:hypothetical protein